MIYIPEPKPLEIELNIDHRKHKPLSQEDFGKTLESDSAIRRFMNADLRDCDLTKIYFEDFSFLEVGIAGVEINGAHFENTQFVIADFQGVVFINCTFDGSNFVKSDLTEARFVNCNFIDSGFTSCDLSKVRFEKSQLKNFHLVQCRVHEVHFSVCVLSSSSVIITSDLKQAVFESCTFDGATLMGCQFDQVRFMGKNLFSNIRFQGMILKDMDFNLDDDITILAFTECRLSNIKLENKMIYDFSFGDCVLENCSFRESVFLVSFQGNYAECIQCDFSDSKARTGSLKKTLFKNCNLEGIAWHQVSLVKSVFEKSVLNRANVSNSNFTACDFLECECQNMNLLYTRIIGLREVKVNWGGTNKALAIGPNKEEKQMIESLEKLQEKSRKEQRMNKRD